VFNQANARRVGARQQADLLDLQRDMQNEDVRSYRKEENVRLSFRERENQQRKQVVGVVARGVIASLYRVMYYSSNSPDSCKHELRLLPTATFLLVVSSAAKAPLFFSPHGEVFGLFGH
jgi:hypothetical protein